MVNHSKQNESCPPMRASHTTGAALTASLHIWYAVYTLLCCKGSRITSIHTNASPDVHKPPTEHTYAAEQDKHQFAAQCAMPCDLVTPVTLVHHAQFSDAT